MPESSSPFRKTTGDDATAGEGSLGTSPRLNESRPRRPESPRVLQKRPGAARGFSGAGSAPRRHGYRRRRSRLSPRRSVPMATPLSLEPEPGLPARQADRAESLASARHLCGVLNEVGRGQDADAARGSRALLLREPGRLVPGRGFSALGQVGGPTPTLLLPACGFRVGASVAPPARKKPRDAHLGLRMWLRVYEVAVKGRGKRFAFERGAKVWYSNLFRTV